MDEQLKQQVLQLVTAYQQGDQKAAAMIGQIMEAAKKGDQQAVAIFDMIQNILQQQAQFAKFGAKLNYISSLKGECPEGYEMQYLKAGGKTCKKCVKKCESGKKVAKSDIIEEFKKGRKVKKCETGSVTRVSKETYNTEDGTETIIDWSDKTQTYINRSRDMKGRPIIYVTGRDGKEYNSIDHTAKVDSVLKKDENARRVPVINLNKRIKK